MTSALGSIDGTALFLSMVIGSVGLALFVYGKKTQRMPQLVAGLVFMVYPYFATTTWTMLAVGALLGPGLYVALWLGW
jgi:hypothetical protein